MVNGTSLHWLVFSLNSYLPRLALLAKLFELLRWTLLPIVISRIDVPKYNLNNISGI